MAIIILKRNIRFNALGNIYFVLIIILYIVNFSILLENMSSSSGRSSSGGGVKAKGSTYDVNESLQFATVLLDGLTEKIIENMANVDDKLLESWRDQILNSSKDSANLTNENKDINTLIHEIESKQIKNFATNTIADRINEVKEISKKRLSKFDGSTTDNYKKIKKAFDRKLSKGDDDDEDLVVNNKLTEADFKCPFSGTKYVEPMKRFVQFVI